MRRFVTALLWCGLLLPGGAAEAAKARILKVLPHYLDQQGRHALSPSLYERDAYQAELRRHPNECLGIRFDVQWRAKSLDRSKAKLRLELRTSKRKAPEPLILEGPLKSNAWFGHWSSLTLGGDGFQQMGDVIAWRATLWEGDRLLAEQKSFLW